MVGRSPDRFSLIFSPETCFYPVVRGIGYFACVHSTPPLLRCCQAAAVKQDECVDVAGGTPVWLSTSFGGGVFNHLRHLESAVRSRCQEYLRRCNEIPPPLSLPNRSNPQRMSLTLTFSHSTPFYRFTPHHRYPQRCFPLSGCLMQARVCVLVQENMALISSIRENMVMGRFFDNHSLMIAFDKNVKEVTALLATLPFADMQKLPVQVNERNPRAIPAVPLAPFGTSAETNDRSTTKHSLDFAASAVSPQPRGC